MSVLNIVRAPRYADDFRSVLKAEYNASMKTMQGFWVVVDTQVGLFIGKMEAWNPDHGDLVLNSVERVDAKITADKLWVRGSQVRTVYMVSKNSKDAAVKVAQKVLSRRGEEL